MKNRLNPSDITSTTVTGKLRKSALLQGILVTGLVSLSGCLSDSKACTDADVSADPAAAFDLGATADPSDYGGSDADVGTADPVANGNQCADFD